MASNPYAAPHFHSLSGQPSSAQAEAEYSVDCECGARISVRASDAGAAVTCRCRRMAPVPKLSILRTAKGLGAHETNIRDTIARMIRDGVLPFGPCCAVTGMPTDDVMWFDVHCERSFSKGSKRWGTFLIVASFLMPLGFLFRLFGAEMIEDSAQRFGHDISIAVPLKVQQHCQARLKRWTTQNRLRRLLCSVPVYQELLREHRTARIVPK